MKRLALLLLIIPAIATYAEPLPLPPDSVTYLPIIAVDGNDKHGLAYSYRYNDNMAWYNYRVTWYYHWSSNAFSQVPSFVEFVPMLWCDGVQHKANLQRYFDSSYTGYLMVGNEPEFSDQCGITPGRMAELVRWASEHYPLAKLVAPHSNVCWWENRQPVPPCGIYGERFTVEAFILAYRDKYGSNPPLHAYGLHYGDPLYWTGRIGAFLDSYGIDALLWYSEWNYCGNNVRRLEEILNHLNNDDRVERYAYWSNMRADNECALSDGTQYPARATWRGKVYATFGD